MNEEKQHREQDWPAWRVMTWPWLESRNQLTGCCVGPIALYGTVIVIIGVILYFFISWLTH